MSDFKLIRSLLKDQEQVIGKLDELNERIEQVLQELTAKPENDAIDEVVVTHELNLQVPGEAAIS
ncbi:MAG: hypothetical protein R3C03_09185 [Pirellulaceae bacterium]